MAARRYEIFHERGQRTCEIFFNTRREVSYLRVAMYYSIYYINTNEILNHSKKGIERRDFHT